MKKQKLFTLLIPIFFVFGNVGYGQTYSTINIDGTEDFAANEEISGTSGSTWYFTWDQNNIYFGLDASDVNSDNEKKWVQLYFDTDPTGSNGTNTGITYNTQQPGLPFDADYHFRWKADGTYVNIQEFNGSNWVDAGATFGSGKDSEVWQSGTYIEISIKRSFFGNPDAIQLVGAMLNETGGAEYTYFMMPNSNSEGYDADYDHYQGYLLIQNITPNNSNYEDADIQSFDGTTNNDWHTSSNWDDGSIPGTSSLVIIPTDGQATISSGKATGNCYDLILQSDGTGTGSLIVEGGISIGNAASFERYIVGYDPSGSDGWHLLSSPVDGMSISGSEFEPDDWSGNEDDLYAWDEANNLWNNYETGGVTSFNNGQGYLVAYQTTATHDFTGTPNVNDVDRNLSYTSGQGEGWNLLGNPFQSAIKWNDGNWDATIGGNVQATAKIRDESAGNYIDISSGDTDIIPANQGFFVKTGADVTGFTIPKASRLHNSQNFYKNTKIASGYLKIKVSAAENSFADIFRVWSHEEANDEYDAYDMEHFYGNDEAPQFYGIHTEAGNLSTYSLNPIAIENSRSINLGIEAPEGEYNLTVETNTLEGDNDIYLHDQVTGEFIDLNEIDNHSFMVNEGNPTERFELLLNKTSTGIDKPHSEELEDVQVYSNQNTIHVNSNQKLSNVTVTVYNPLGQRIMQKPLNVTQNTIDIENKGTYIVRIKADEGVKSEKVIIQ